MLFKGNASVFICDSRAFLKHAAEIVYYLDGRNVSVVLQGKKINNYINMRFCFTA